MDLELIKALPSWALLALLVGYMIYIHRGLNKHEDKCDDRTRRIYNKMDDFKDHLNDKIDGVRDQLSKQIAEVSREVSDLKNTLIQKGNDK